MSDRPAGSGGTETARLLADNKNGRTVSARSSVLAAELWVGEPQAGKTPPSPCVSTAIVAKTLPQHHAFALRWSSGAAPGDTPSKALVWERHTAFPCASTDILPKADAFGFDAAGRRRRRRLAGGGPEFPRVGGQQPVRGDWRQSG